MQMNSFVFKRKRERERERKEREREREKERERNYFSKIEERNRKCGKASANEMKRSIERERIIQFNLLLKI
jgi:hypothetical protein